MSSETSLGSTIEPVRVKLSSRLTKITDTTQIQNLIDDNAQNLHNISDLQSKHTNFIELNISTKCIFLLNISLF